MNPIISIFTRHTDLEPSANITLTKVLEAIRQPRERVTKLIAAIRSEPDKAKRRELKGQLPAICFGAQLKTRDGKASAAEKIQAESGIVCLDLDDIEDLDATKARLEGQKHILAVFVSPSGNGLKVLVPILGGFQTHWRALSHHMESEYQLKADEARKDVVGLCYASHDPAIWVAPDMSAVEVFAEVREDPRPRHQPGQTLIGHMPNDGEVLADFLDGQEAGRALSKLNPDCEYQEWIAIGQAIHCQFSGSSQGLSLWDSWSSRGSKYAGSEDVSKHYQSFRASGITFRTVLKPALAAGYTMPRRTSSTAVSIVPERPAKRDFLGERIAAEADGSYALVSWPWPEITKLSRSLLPGTITLLCGASGSSKSWFTMTCLRHWISIGVSAEVLMIEEDEGWHLNRALAMIERDIGFLDELNTKADATQKLAAHTRNKKTTDAIGERLTCVPNVTMSACAKWIEDRCAAGVRVLVIDPITLADHGKETKWEADGALMARARAACTASGASLVLVSHPVKAGGMQKGPPQMDDMAGGAVYNRAAASLLWLSGSEEQETVITKHGETKTMDVHKRVMVLKARNGTGAGKAVAYQFNALNFDELGMIVPSESKNSAKRKNECAIAREAKAMEMSRRAQKVSSTPHPREDSFLGPTP